MSSLIFVVEEVAEQELDPAHFRHAQTSPSQDGLLKGHLDYLLRPLTQQAWKVQQDVDLLCLRLPQPCGLRDPAESLSDCGHKVSIHKSEGGHSGVAAFRKLRHAYLTISITVPTSVHEEEEQQQQQQDEVEGDGGELLVDPHFASQFLVAAPTPRYAALQRLLPQAFVGSRQQLGQVVEWVCREMEHSFRDQGQALPPWREWASMRTKWHPQQQAQQQAQAQQQHQHQQQEALSEQQQHCEQLGVGQAGAPPGTSPPAPCGCCMSQAQLQQAAVLLACASAPGTPRHTHSQKQSLDRVSLLSLSLEAAGLRRGASSPTHPLALERRWAPFGSWEHTQPRVHVVRRSVPH